MRHLFRCLVAISYIMLHTTVAQAASLPPQASSPVLERVVLIARHGIRSPTHPIAELDARTHRQWQAWPVAPGELTEHGQRDLSLMGMALGQYYREAGVLPAQGCRAGELAVWSDAADRRTLQTGDIMGHAMIPGCPVTPGSLPPGVHDPVFNDLPGQASSTLRQAIMTDLSTALARDRNTRPPSVRLAQEMAQAIIQPAGCTSGLPCYTAPDRAVWSNNAPHLSGGLSQSAEVAENMLLEYAQGMPCAHIGWGHPAMRHAIDTLQPAHTYASQLLRRLPAVAFPRGHILAGMIMDLVTGKAVREPNGDMIAATTPVILFAGHDSTLDMLAAIFGLNWSFADMPDPTGPDTTLGFETWRMPNGQRQVRVVIFHQALDALRMEQFVAIKPDILTLQACHHEQDDRCTMDNFTRIFNDRFKTGN
ncbi:histidine-type phosphatase [Komagataeibacter sucrofermentans]|uniref:Phosphoanhydride phosphohydrolase n=1 Tax=Komagataeibacter sucrofermentans TaxID=1053551 RepID=A0A318QKY6_9PROT|nr:histidine-type phosphatase [Komagataeibacter sucrofermentans]PYD78048.1 phosphoanhydride phosphohydrolase [Komagataeibacter sucrofermentans]